MIVDQIIRRLNISTAAVPELKLDQDFELMLESMASEELCLLQNELSKITALVYAKTVRVLLDFSNKVYAVQKSHMSLNTASTQENVAPVSQIMTRSTTKPILKPRLQNKSQPITAKTLKLDKKTILDYLAKLDV